MSTVCIIYLASYLDGTNLKYLIEESECAYGLSNIVSDRLRQSFSEYAPGHDEDYPPPPLYSDIQSGWVYHSTLPTDTTADNVHEPATNAPTDPQPQLLSDSALYTWLPVHLRRYICTVPDCRASSVKRIFLDSKSTFTLPWQYNST